MKVYIFLFAIIAVLWGSQVHAQSSAVAVQEKAPAGEKVCSARSYEPTSSSKGCSLYKYKGRILCKTVRNGKCKPDWCPKCYTPCRVSYPHYCYPYARKIRGRYVCLMRRGSCGCKRSCPVEDPPCGRKSYVPNTPKLGCQLSKKTYRGRTRYYCQTLRNGKCLNHKCPWCTNCTVTRNHYCLTSSIGGKPYCRMIPGSCGCKKTKEECTPTPTPGSPTPTPEGSPTPTPEAEE